MSNPRLPPPWGSNPEPHPDDTVPDWSYNDPARTSPSFASKPGAAPSDSAAVSPPRHQMRPPAAFLLGVGCMALVGAIILLLLPVIGGRHGGSSHVSSSSLKTPVVASATPMQPSPTSAATATSGSASCTLPTNAVPAHQQSKPFHFSFLADVEAGYVPAQETEASGIDTLPLFLCSPHKSFSQLQGEITVDAPFWHTLTPCAGVACWSAAGISAAGNPYTLFITLAHTSPEDTGALFSLAMTTTPANHGTLAQSNDTYSPEPHATTADFEWTNATSISPLGSALAALPATGLTYDTLHLSAIAQNCGNTQPAYSSNAIEVATTSVICARTNDGRYAKLQISYTSKAIAIIQGIVYPTEFW